jgi:hypothetical protein
VTLEAIPPSWLGGKIHLYSEGYQPGNKSRRGGHTPPCGVFVHIGQWELRVPLAEAVAAGWGTPAFIPPLPPTVQQGRQWHWCRACIGHALFIVGLLPDVIASLAGHGWPAAPPERECLRPERCAGCTGRTCTKGERFARDHGLQEGS